MHGLGRQEMQSALQIALNSIYNLLNFAPAGKTMRWIEKWLHLLELSRRSLSACKVWGDRTTRAGCMERNSKLVFFVCHAWSACAWRI